MSGIEVIDNAKQHLAVFLAHNARVSGITTHSGKNLLAHRLDFLVVVVGKPLPQHVEHKFERKRGVDAIAVTFVVTA